MAKENEASEWVEFEEELKKNAVFLGIAATVILPLLLGPAFLYLLVTMGIGAWVLYPDRIVNLVGSHLPVAIGGIVGILLALPLGPFAILGVVPGAWLGHYANHKFNLSNNAARFSNAASTGANIVYTPIRWGQKLGDFLQQSKQQLTTKISDFFAEDEIDRQEVSSPKVRSATLVFSAPAAIAQNDIAQNDIAQNDIAQNDIAQNDIAQNDVDNDEYFDASDEPFADDEKVVVKPARRSGRKRTRCRR